MLTEMEVFVEVKLDVSNLVARITEQDGKRVERVSINPAEIVIFSRAYFLNSSGCTAAVKTMMSVSAAADRCVTSMDNRRRMNCPNTMTLNRET
jgi:hypothetical protein